MRKCLEDFEWRKGGGGGLNNSEVRGLFGNEIKDMLK